MKFLKGLLVAGVALSSVAVAADEGVKPESALEKTEERMICKRVSTIGSLVKKRRVCMTSRQWKESAARSQDLTTEMQKPSGAPR